MQCFVEIWRKVSDCWQASLWQENVFMLALLISSISACAPSSSPLERLCQVSYLRRLCRISVVWWWGDLYLCFKGEVNNQVLIATKICAPSSIKYLRKRVLTVSTLSILPVGETWEGKSSLRSYDGKLCDYGISLQLSLKTNTCDWEMGKRISELFLPIQTHQEASNGNVST